MRDVEARVGELRGHLLAAGVTRPELHDGTRTQRPFDVRSFRTTFATWCARSGFDSAWTDVWLGHAAKTTTAKHYVKSTGEMTGGVFPVLSGSGLVPAFWLSPTHDFNTLRCEGRDLNPYRSYPTGT